jgi:flagellar biosynthesis protein FlhB
LARETFGEQTERATPKRREEARREGKVARSGELTSSLVLLAGVGALAAFSGSMVRGLADLTRGSLIAMSTPAETQGSVYAIFTRLSLEMTRILLPFVLTVAAVGLAANVAQVGFMISTGPLSPRWAMINPVEGFKRIFSLRSATELVKAILKVAVIGAIAYATVSSDLSRLIPLQGAEGGAVLTHVGQSTVRLGLRVGFALLALAVLDYGYQRWEYERSLRMSRQEIIEEQKQTEGDPQIKARIRLLQRLNARRRMMQDVAKATVVVTNPTHYAVALKYERTQMAAPLVVGKGMRKLAERIKETARQNRVPIVEDPPLARLLYKEGKLGRPIPVSLYRAVAQVLAHVWRLRQRAAGVGIHD